MKITQSQISSCLVSILDTDVVKWMLRRDFSCLITPTLVNIDANIYINFDQSGWHFC